MIFLFRIGVAFRKQWKHSNAILSYKSFLWELAIPRRLLQTCRTRYVAEQFYLCNCELLMVPLPHPLPHRSFILSLSMQQSQPESEEAIRRTCWIRTHILLEQLTTGGKPTLKYISSVIDHLTMFALTTYPKEYYLRFCGFVSHTKNFQKYFSCYLNVP